MKLLGLTPSPFFRKCIIVMEEKGLDYDVETLMPFQKTESLMSMNPLGKIPILVDQDFAIPDSSVICAYLEKRFPVQSLYPEDPLEYAYALFWVEYADTKMVQVIGTVLFERLAKPIMVPRQQADEELIERCLNVDLPPIFDYLESKIPHNQDYIYSKLSIADISIGVHLASLKFIGYKIDSDRWPRTSFYFDKLMTRPSFVKSMINQTKIK